MFVQQLASLADNFEFLRPVVAHVQTIDPDLFEHFHPIDVVAVGVTLLYLVMVFMGPLLMSSKPAFSGHTFQRVWLWWNIVLALYSVWAVVYGIQCSWVGYTKFGWPEFLRAHRWEGDEVCVLWGYAYTISKFVEFGDTLFLILKKKDVAFLHWIHHTLTCMVVWKWSRETRATDGLARFLATANSIAHVLLYTYYAVQSTSLKEKMPSWVPRSLTTYQILQMMYLCWGINYGHFVVHAVGFVVYIFYFPMVALFLYLFSKLYYDRYVREGGKGKGKGKGKGGKARESKKEKAQ